MVITNKCIYRNLGSVQVLRHRVRGGPASIADTDDALREGWAVKNQNDVILEYVSDKYVFM